MMTLACRAYGLWRARDMQLPDLLRVNPTCPMSWPATAGDFRRGDNLSKRAETRNCPAFQRLRTQSSDKNTTESERGRFPRPSQFDRSSSGLMRTE